jgi:hypothetical protein
MTVMKSTPVVALTSSATACRRSDGSGPVRASPTSGSAASDDATARVISSASLLSDRSASSTSTVARAATTIAADTATTTKTRDAALPCRTPVDMALLIDAAHPSSGIHRVARRYGAGPIRPQIA